MDGAPSFGVRTATRRRVVNQVGNEAETAAPVITSRVERLRHCLLGNGVVTTHDETCNDTQDVITRK